MSVLDAKHDPTLLVESKVYFSLLTLVTVSVVWLFNNSFCTKIFFHYLLVKLLLWKHLNNEDEILSATELLEYPVAGPNLGSAKLSLPWVGCNFGPCEGWEYMFFFQQVYNNSFPEHPVSVVIKWVRVKQTSFFLISNFENYNILVLVYIFKQAENLWKS